MLCLALHWGPVATCLSPRRLLCLPSPPAPDQKPQDRLPQPPGQAGPVGLGNVCGVGTSCRQAVVGRGP